MHSQAYTMSEELIQDINVGCIVFLILTMIVLIAATRLRNGIGYMGMVVVSTTVPVYLSNLMRELGSDAFEMSLYIAGTINVLCFPSLWFFVHSQLDRPFRFKPVMLFHFVPSLISLGANLLFYIPLTPEEVALEREILNSGTENLPALVNDVLLFGQYLTYFPYLFIYVYRRKRYLLENFTDADYLLLIWLPRFLWFFFLLFTIVFVAYIIAPRTDAWLIPLLNTAGMAYLTYCSVRYVPTVPIERPKAEEVVREEPKTASAPVLSKEQMQEICERATRHLAETRSYLNSDITLASLAKEISIPQRNLSRAINSHLGCNFFEFVNTMRVEYAKQRLLELETAEYNIDSVYHECGFRSRSTFFLVFKKLTGKTPAAWLADARK